MARCPKCGAEIQDKIHVPLSYANTHKQSVVQCTCGYRIVYQHPQSRTVSAEVAARIDRENAAIGAVFKKIFIATTLAAAVYYVASEASAGGNTFRAFITMGLWWGAGAFFKKNNPKGYFNNIYIIIFIALIIFCVIKRFLLV